MQKAHYIKKVCHLLTLPESFSRACLNLGASGYLLAKRYIQIHKLKKQEGSSDCGTLSQALTHSICSNVQAAWEEFTTYLKKDLRKACMPHTLPVYLHRGHPIASFERKTKLSRAARHHSIQTTRAKQKYTVACRQNINNYIYFCILLFL